jgi:hypothetical protein
MFRCRWPHVAAARSVTGGRKTLARDGVGERNETNARAVDQQRFPTLAVQLKHIAQ